MKTLSIHIFFGIFLLCSSFVIAHAASSDKAETRESTHTQHPPHDHHQTDHIKKLDEGMQRRRTKKLN